MRRTALPLAVLVLLSAGLPAAGPALEHGGMFIRECSLPGETRKDDVFPRRATCVQLARARWLVVYGTRGYRGVDDERSVIYQVRRDAPDGPVLKEGFLARARAGWRPEGVPPPAPGKDYFKQHGHAVAFGVPKGALVDGKLAPHANLFVAQWRVLGRVLVVKEDRLEKTYSDRVLFARTQDVEWAQFRLNDREDDIEIVQPVRPLRPAAGKLPAAWMNQSFCPPVPFNARADEWVVCNHFDRARLAVLKFRYDPASKRYAWVETGPFLAEPKRPLSEASLVRLPEGWLISARSNGAIAWFRARDLFAPAPRAVFSKEPLISAPHTTFRCADGVVRLFGGDVRSSPHRYDRDPLYVWDVLLDGGVTVTNRRVVFFSEGRKLDMRRAVRPRIDFAELFPPHGRTQVLTYSVTPRAYNHPYEGTKIPAATARDKAASGLYFSRLRYDREAALAWRFD